MLHRQTQHTSDQVLGSSHMTQFDGLWRNPAFLRFWAADAVSVFGSLITRIALPFTAILMLDASAFEMSLLVMADLVPSCVVGLPVGVWVDRRRRLPLMIAADVMRAAVLVSIPIAAAFDALTLVQLYAVAFVASALTVLFNVAQISILPALVSREDLLEANSKTSATQSVSEIGAFGIGGWLVQLLSGPGAILIDAVSFLASAVLLRSVPVRRDGASSGGTLPHATRDCRGPEPCVAPAAVAGNGSGIHGAVVRLQRLRDNHQPVRAQGTGLRSRAARNDLRGRRRQLAFGLRPCPGR